MTRPVLEVNLAGVGSSARGWGARRIITEITGRPPVWIPSIRAWSIQEATARDVVAAAERAGYDVLITGPRASRSGADHRDQHLGVDHHQHLGVDDRGLW